MINKFSGNIVFMNTIGNHEADTKTPLGGSLLFKGTKSGGECSVVSNTLFPYPSEKAGYNRPWLKYSVTICCNKTKLHSDIRK